MTYPTTPPRPDGRPCYTCAHLWDVAPAGHATCHREKAKGFIGVQPTPEGGCVYWTHDPARPIVSTREEWRALHGPGLTGFSERSEREYRPAMTAQDVRAAAARGDAKALGWEVARIHDTLRRTVDALHAMQLRIELRQFREDIELLRQLLAEREPAVATHLQGVAFASSSDLSLPPAVEPKK